MQEELIDLILKPSRDEGDRSLPPNLLSPTSIFNYSHPTAARVSDELRVSHTTLNTNRKDYTVASTQPQPAGMSGGGGPGTTGGGGGFKLKLTLGGQSAAPPAPTQAQPTPIPHPAPTEPNQQQYWNPQGPIHDGQQPHSATGAGQETLEEKRVSAEKYKRLKKKYLEAVESRDEASLSLYRAQKLIHRLRQDKSSLLDRVLELEIAAGITSADVLNSQQVELRTERELAFPLLNPPDLPSMEDRPRPLPVLTTSTDFSNSNYNAPLGPEPLPKTFPPRQRSQHLQTAIAAQKLRDDYDSKLAAQGLQRASFPAVAALGLEGSNIALTVERALAGEPLEPVSVHHQQQQHQQSTSSSRGNKRRRQSSTTTGGGAGAVGHKSYPVPQVQALESIQAPQEQSTLQYLPNPFAAVGAIPEGSTMARNTAEALAAAQATADVTAQIQQQLQQANPYEISVSGDGTPGIGGDYDMEEGGSEGSGVGSGGEEEDYKPNIGGGAGGRRGGRQSAGPDKPSRSKRSKGSALTPGIVTIPLVPRNSDGTPRLPLAAGIMTLTNLGVVSNQEGFHTERYIFPIGYEAIRRYPSMVNKTADVEYTCRIVDGGQGGPRFELHPADQPGNVIHAQTPTGAWSQVVKAANKLRERNHSNSVSGPDYYGLSNNLVKALIQELPGANTLPNYIMQTFIEDVASAAAPAKGKKGKKAGGRRKSKAATEEGEEYPNYGIEVEEGAYDASGYGNGIGEAFTREGSYDSGSYPASASPEDSTGYGVGGGADYSNPASLANLLQGGGAAAQADPYSIPAFGDSNSHQQAPFDPYAIPPAQPAFGGYPATGSYGAYDLPGGQTYASSEASST
ncbi:hypothetical protein JCM3765_005697 [Sporobolomyces pararoseus]